MVRDDACVHRGTYDAYLVPGGWYGMVWRACNNVTAEGQGTTLAIYPQQSLLRL